MSQKNNFKKEGLAISVCYYVEVKVTEKILAFILVIRSLAFEKVKKEQRGVSLCLQERIESYKMELEL